MNTTLNAVLSLLAIAITVPAQQGEPPKPDQKASVPAASAAAKKPDATGSDAAVAAIDAFIAAAKVDKKNDGWRTSLVAPPVQQFAADCDYFWHLETSAGKLRVRYFPDTAPMHVTSGIYLSRLGYYDGLVFHRIIPGFMAQGGCPLGAGSGGPGYYMDGEFQGNRKHDRPGLLSMANTGRPRSDGSQFFLTFVPTPWLDGKHTIWGEIVEGMETLKALEKLGTQSGAVAKPPRIDKAWITVEPKAKPKPAAGDGKSGEPAGGKTEKAGC